MENLDRPQILRFALQLLLRWRVEHHSCGASFSQMLNLNWNTSATICQLLIDVNKYSFEQIKGDCIISLIEVIVLYRYQLFRKQYNWYRLGR